MLHNLGSKTTLGSRASQRLARTATGVGSGFDLQGSNDAEGESLS
jgi:hypothetical protein